MKRFPAEKARSAGSSTSKSYEPVLYPYRFSGTGTGRTLFQCCSCTAWWRSKFHKCSAGKIGLDHRYYLYDHCIPRVPGSCRTHRFSLYIINADHANAFDITLTFRVLRVLFLVSKRRGGCQCYYLCPNQRGNCRVSVREFIVWFQQKLSAIFFDGRHNTHRSLVLMCGLVQVLLRDLLIHLPLYRDSMFTALVVIQTDCKCNFMQLCTWSGIYYGFSKRT